MEVSAGVKRLERKKLYKTKLEELLRTYKNILIVGVDNVGSLQMQKIRISLRGKAVVCMGKNTLMRMIITQQLEQQPKLETLIPLIKGNVGLVFTNHDLAEIRNLIVSNRVPAAAKPGTIAPTDVFVPPGPTGLEPGQTSFFQALNIATKIVRTSIEIINEVHLIKKGAKVTSSAVALLSKLDMKPFFYGVLVRSVYENGSVYPVHILDVTQEELLAKFMSGVQKLSAIGTAINYPTTSTVPYVLAGSFKKIFAIALESGYDFKEVTNLKAAAAAGPAPTTGGGGAGAGGGGGKQDKKGGKEDKKKEVKEEPKKEEPKEEPEEDMGGLGGLFE